MHEMALCTEVVKSVLAIADEADAVSVDEVSMVIGETRDIIIDMFDSFFHFLARDTIAENATVVYTTVPVMVECRDCGHRFPLDIRSKTTVGCPSCSNRNYKMISGNEFLIESIDVTTREEQALAV